MADRKMSLRHSKREPKGRERKELFTPRLREVRNRFPLYVSPFHHFVTSSSAKCLHNSVSNVWEIFVSSSSRQMASARSTLCVSLAAKVTSGGTWHARLQISCHVSRLRRKEDINLQTLTLTMIWNTFRVYEVNI
jgi:hypothetical protein